MYNDKEIDLWWDEKEMKSDRRGQLILVSLSGVIQGVYKGLYKGCFQKCQF